MEEHKIQMVLYDWCFSARKRNQLQHALNGNTPAGRRMMNAVDNTAYGKVETRVATETGKKQLEFAQSSNETAYVGQPQDGKGHHNARRC